ncbi:hypothetical protein KHQ88_07040 [Mycoplasmatota bacterium]|nr:hypothetical protein KHQ88_07040 [Mycoplasmatota bacterium]
MLSKRRIIISLIVIAFLILTYVVVERQVPIHMSSLKVENKRVFYQETTRLIQCDVAYTEVLVYEDEEDEYYYQLIEIGNGSCLSELYIWDNLHYYTLTQALDEEIILLDDLLDSHFIIERSKSTDSIG